MAAGDKNRMQEQLRPSVLSGLSRRVVLVPLIVACLLAFGSFSGWQLIKDQQTRQLESDARNYVNFTGAKLEAHVAGRLVLGELIRQEWMNERQSTAAEFTRIVSPKLNRFPDILAINWLDNEGIIRWVNPLEANKKAIGLDVKTKQAPAEALGEAVRTGAQRVSAPVALAQGGIGVVSYTPTVRSGVLTGFINIVFRTSTLVQFVLPDETGNDYNLRIMDGDQEVFTLSDNVASDKVLASTSIHILNRTWRVLATPTDATKRKFYSATAEVFLLLSLLVSIALALLLRMLMMRHVALHESEDRFADFAAVSSDWFWETDADLKFSFFSDRFEDVTGTSPGLLLGKTRREVGAPGADPDKFADMLAAMDARQPFRDFEHLRQKTNGDVVSLSISGRPIFDESGEFLGYRGIGRDISEERRTREALREALVASEEANQAKSEFLATMSHEFRTPLNAILGFSELLRAQYFGPLGAENYLEYAEDIHSSGAHLLTLVNDVLDISAIEAKKRKLDKEDLILIEIVYEGVKNIQADLLTKNLELDVNIPDDLPLIWADRRSVYQIVLNLIVNSVKFTEPGGKIVVAAETDDAHVVLIVEDTGIGIAEDKLPRITEPFAQLQSDAKLAEEGAGLGLAIVKSLIEAHEGRLEIESEFGVGTKVSVLFKR